MVIAEAERIEYDGSSVQAVLARDVEGKEIRLECTDVVVATGPWSGKLMRKLFKEDKLVNADDYDITSSRAHSVCSFRMPMYAADAFTDAWHCFLRLSRPQIVVRSSEPLSAHALFTSIKTGKKSSEPELYARPDGTGYLCGPTDNEPLPDRADQVKVSRSAIATLKAEAAIISPHALGEKAVVEAEQACYLPYSRRTGSPILAKLREGVFFAAGHSCWGIQQGPGTGLAMSELILDDKVSCCDVSLLTP